MVCVPCLFLRLWNWAWIVLKLSTWCLDRKSYVGFIFLGSAVHINLWVQRLIMDIIYALQFTLFGDMFLFHLSEVNMSTSSRQEVQIYLKSQHWERYCKLMLAESLYSTARKTADEEITLSAQCCSQISISSASLIIPDFSQSNLQSDSDTREPIWGTALWGVHQEVERLKEPQEAK